MLARFDPAGGFQFVDRLPWIASYNIEYFVGVDGLSITMVLLTALLSFLCMIASFNIEKAVKGYFALFLLLETGMMGTFVRPRLLPVLRLLGGHAAADVLPDRHLGRPAAGVRRDQVLPLHVARLGADAGGDARALLHAGPALLRHDRSSAHWWPTRSRCRCSCCSGRRCSSGFAIKIPVFPFHTWLPDAHVEAPTAISVILAGVLLKMGTYGILRINYGILPAATLADFWGGHSLAFWLLAVLGTWNIVYGAFCAWRSRT